MKFKSFSLLTLIASTVLVAMPAQAQEFSSDPDWKITAYLWTLGLEGQLGIGPIQEDIDLGFTDLLSELDIGGAVAVRRDQGHHSLLLDAQYYKLSPSADGPLGGTIDNTLKLPIISAAYGYKFGEPDSYGIFMGGVRYMKTDLRLDLTPNLPGPGEPSLRREADPDFTDFFIGFLGFVPVSEKWNLLLQGDYGAGGSNGTWIGGVLGLPSTMTRGL